MKTGIYAIVKGERADNVNLESLFTVVPVNGGMPEYFTIENEKADKLDIEVGNFYIYILSESGSMAIQGGRKSIDDATEIFHKLNRVFNPQQYPQQYPHIGVGVK